MRHKGSKAEFSQERDCDLLRAYRDYIATCRYIRQREVLAAVVDMPSKRFWVSTTRAALIVSAMMKGRPVLDSMWPQHREMFEEIYRRVVALGAERPELGVADLCAIVVLQPAPKFFLTPGSAKVIICKARRKWMEMKLESLRRSVSRR